MILVSMPLRATCIVKTKHLDIHSTCMIFQNIFYDKHNCDVQRKPLYGFYDTFGFKAVSNNMLWSYNEMKKKNPTKTPLTLASDRIRKASLISTLIEDNPFYNEEVC